MRRAAIDFPIFFAPAAWRPAADVYRNDTGWLVKIDLAGVSRADVEVQLTPDGLVVRGRRFDGVVDRSWRRQRLEITYSAFERLVELPTNDADLETEFVNGMLLVRLRTRSRER